MGKNISGSLDLMKCSKSNLLNSRRVLKQSTLLIVKWGQSEKMEVVLKNLTDIEDSSKKFEVDVMEKMTLDKIGKTDEFEIVTVTAKVVGIEASMQVTGGLSKQDVYLSDASATVKLTLWEQDIGKVVEGCSYLFTDVLVRSYNGEKYLKGALIEVQQLQASVEQDSSLDNCLVIGVDNFNVYRVCLSCKLQVL